MPNVMLRHNAPPTQAPAQTTAHTLRDHCLFSGAGSAVTPPPQQLKDPRD